jgi:carboxyl-terminal processing protease
VSESARERESLRDGDKPEPQEIDGYVAVALFALGVTAGMLVLLIAFQLIPEPEDETLAEFREIRDFAARYYVDDVPPEELTSRALKGMLQSLDVHSTYFDRASSEGQRRRVDGDFRGTGIWFRVDRRGPQILFPIKDTPAWDAGIRVGDRILEIDGKSMDGLTGEDLRSHLVPAGQEVVRVRLEALDGEIRTVEVEPALLVDPSVRHVRIIDDAPGIGYLAITSFTNNTSEEFDVAVTELMQRGARALVIDLRFDYGGVLDAAVHVVGRFVESGVVVSSEGRVAREVHRADDVEPLFGHLDLCVLVNGSSASASEIVAGALQDYRAAVVVGEPTYGKGLIQTTRAFPRYGSRAKVTSGYFYSPSKRNFDKTVDPGRDYGILPDLFVEVSREKSAEIQEWLRRYDPPTELLDQLEAWDAMTEEAILPAPPWIRSSTRRSASCAA